MLSRHDGRRGVEDTAFEYSRSKRRPIIADLDDRMSSTKVEGMLQCQCSITPNHLARQMPLP
jgi:hypothetical protein